MKRKIFQHSRRQFIRNSGCAALGGTTFLSTLLNLKSLGASASFNSSAVGGGQYKALVCLMFSGGNDSYNMLVPTNSSEYTAYSTSRSNLAIPANELLDLTNNSGSSRTFGVHPSMPRLRTLFNDGKAAFVSNIGSLIAPITKTEFYNSSVETPLGLYSHADQIMHWQTGIPNARVATGWGGKMSELLAACNTNQSLSMNMSLSGTNVFQTGESSVEFSLHPTQGAVGIYDDNDDWIINSAKKTATDSMLDANYYDVFKNTYNNITKTGREGAAQIQAALETSPTYTTPFSENYVSNSFEMVANMIASRNVLGMNRQIFFIDVGGWDNHDELVDTQAYNLMRIDNALYEFNAAIEQLGLADDVTTFSVSEFGRTLSSNGYGSDHGWGGNVFAMGGAVNGGQMYGDYPLLDLGGNLEVGGGVFIPTTSADEYFAEIAMWFGVADSDLNTLFPNLGNFYSVGSGNPIGFLTL